MAASASADPTWTGNGDGTSWGDAHNWDTMQVPKNGDSVTIGPTSSQFTPHVTGMPGGTQLQGLALSNASLSGGNVTVAGSFSWDVSGGNVATLAAPLTAQSTASISGMGQENVKNPMTFLGATTITGPGVVQVQDSGVAITNAGVMTLAPGATVEANGCCTSPDVLVNTGTISAPGPGTATVGFLDFNDQGSVQVAPGGVLDVIGGPGEFSAGSSLSGGGTLRFEQSAAITLASPVSVGPGSTMALTGNAKFSGPGGFTGGGKFSWTGGTISGNLDVASGIATTISGTTFKSLTSPATTPTGLTLHGTTTLKGPAEVQLNGTTTLNNLGTLTMGPGTTISAGNCCVSPDHVTNGGTLTVAAGTGVASTTNLAFSNSGTVNVDSGTLSIGTLSYSQTAGATKLAGGSLAAAKQINIGGGTLSGFGTITGSVQNGGTVSPSTTGGVLKITGAYRQTSSGVLSSVIIGASPGTQFGQLSVGGQATLSGTLQVNTGGGFTPAHGQAFSVLVCHSRSGTFATLSGHPTYTVAYSATAARAVYP